MGRTIVYRTTLAFFLLYLSAITTLGQSYSTLDFVKTKPPLYSTDDWYVLNTSTNEFSVSNHNGELVITKARGITNTQFKLPGGKLIGTDNGEFGGQLKFIPKDTPKVARQIKSGNIKIIFQFNDTIYFIEGLAHLTVNNGALYRLDTPKELLAISQLLALRMLLKPLQYMITPFSLPLFKVFM